MINKDGGGGERHSCYEGGHRAHGGLPQSPPLGKTLPGMSYFSFKVQKCPIFKVLNLMKENFNGLALWYFSCTMPRPKFERVQKIYPAYFLVMWKYFRKRDFRAYFLWVMKLYFV